MTITKKHFELFKAECQKWIKIFELNGWNITFWHKKLDPEKHWSQCWVNLNGRQINLKLNTVWDNEVSIDKIKSVAKHECIHALLARFSEIGNARFITDSEIYEAEEELVYKLEKIIKE